KDVDGVITISSSLGYQAAFWKKPLLAIGKSHISTFSTAQSYEELIAQIFTNQHFSQDAKLISLIKDKNLPQDCFSNNKYSDWLDNFVAEGKFTQWCNDVGTELLNRRREGVALESLVPYVNKFGVNSDYHCRELVQQIKRYEIISFDIFDTLLFRPFRHPSDLYDLMEKKAREITGISHLKFKEERRKAEKIAFETAIEAGCGETTIYNIYSVLSENVNLSDECRDILMQYEMQTEYELLYPRKTGYRAYLEAKQLGKRIILVSDMYLPAEFLAKVLDKNGYNEYEKLYVSSSIGLKKHSGALFDYVLDDLQVSPNMVLHIGDNVDADVKKAKEKGIKPFHLMKAYEEYISCSDYTIPWSRDEKRHSLDWSMLLTIAGNHLHDNPYLPFRKNTLFGGSPTKLGYYGFGFLLIGYAKWLIENAIKDNIDRLYFLSRDGKIMKHAYDIVARLYDNAPKSHYLLCSRRAVNLAKVKSCDDIIDLVNVDYANNVRLSHLLLSRFGLDINNIHEETLIKYGFNKNSKLTDKDTSLLQDLLIDLKDDVLLVAENERSTYLQYLHQEGMYDDGNVSIVDIGYAGTMQQSLYQ
ncbi:MAG: HAD-IA family hydrolase, partial [Pluralibacter gergoviae]|nr:HAD-IA family hydrolase [Pluralibacter gergoviae]